MDGLPSSDILLRDSRDFILSSGLGRRALQSSDYPGSALVLCDLISSIHQLVLSCHMPEFTDHGLPHLCSLVDRLSRWELSDGSELVQRISPDEASLLLLATLLHDLGMLSQNPADLPDAPPLWASRDQTTNVADWVRRTHVIRLPKLARRVITDRGHESFVLRDTFKDAVEIAAAHQKWPWGWSGPWQVNPRSRGLASLVAVADLLDEDSARCDTMTLLHHREGDALNRAHWLRHGLTVNRILIKRGAISVTMVRPPRTSGVFAPVYSALRNHFRLVALYSDDLSSLDADIATIIFDPEDGFPPAYNSSLDGWASLNEFVNERAFCFHIR